MVQWLVVNAVGGEPQLGVDGVKRTSDVLHRSVPSTVGDQWTGLIADSSSGDVGGMLMAGVVLLALGLAGVVAWRTRLSGIVSRVRGSDSEGTTAVEDGSQTANSVPQSQSPPSEADDAAASEAAQRTDREIILDILGENEGRMKQANIVDETGWSKSKVSMLLSDMEDDDEISKLRVGRENIISLIGNEPEAAGSPFDDE